MPILKTKTLYPITLTEAKAHLRVQEEYDDDDAYISALIEAATQEAEGYIGKDIALTTNVASIFKFTGNELYIDEGNLITVDQIITDSSTLLTPAVTKTFYNYFEIEFGYQVSYSNDYVPLKVYFTSGYEDGECPEIIKQAIKIKIANMYDVNRQDDSPAYLHNSYASNRLLDRFKIILF